MALPSFPLRNYPRALGQALFSGNRAALFAIGTTVLRIALVPLDRALALLERWFPAAAGGDPQIVFVVGLPRSGSTFVAESLAQSLPVTALSNLMSILPRSRYWMHRLFSLIPSGQRPLTNYYGHGASWLASGDTYAIWDQWLGPDHHLPPPSLSEGGRTDLRHYFCSLHRAYGKPLLAKNNRNALLVDELAQLFPRALFVVTERDREAVVKSVWRATELVGLKDRLWGLSVAGGALHSEDRREACRQQVAELETAFEAKLARIAPERIVRIAYEDFRRSSASFVEALAARLPVSSAQEVSNSVLVGALALLGSALFTLRALCLYSAQFARPWSGDPANHNYAALVGTNFTKLLELVRTQMQPVLEYWLRARVWLPLLGTNERAFRLPSVIYAASFVLLSMGVTYFHLRRRKVGEAFAFLALLCVGAWLSASPFVARLATESRHYPLVAFFSVLWFALGFLDLTEKRWPFYLAGLCFANTHFFAIPLVVSVLIYRTIENWRGKRTALALESLLVAIAVVSATGLVNLLSIAQLFFRFSPRVGMEGVSFEQTVGMVFQQGLAVYALPAFFVWLIFAATSARRNPLRQQFLTVALCLVPLEIWAIHHTSAYAFKDRYHTIFAGLFLLVFLYGFETVRRWTRSSVILPVVLLLLFQVPRQIRTAFTDLPNLRVPEERVTDSWLAYQKIAELGPEPVLLHEHPKGDFRLPRFFLTANGARRAKFFAIGTQGPWTEAEKVRLEGVLENGSHSAIIVDLAKRDRCPTSPTSLSGILRLKPLHRGDRCLQLLEGAKSYADVGVALAKIPF